ncbi:histidine phosphatase family protein [Nocardioides speluncae]|uniref:histidine phosphatase family protein n=1 Tax=Nocardioides speluncae TaxID=2670337 RepID=UPI000D68AEF4|nr:histidine phosphatase family protein [Nocardioides speluncae]
MSVVLLVRHGQASFGAADYDVLSEVGHEQSRVLGKSLAARGVTPDVVIRGGLRRHQQTTDELVGAAGWGNHGEVVVDDGFDEFDHLQIIEAYRPTLRPDQAFQEAFGLAIARWASGEYDADYPEPFTAFEARVVAAAERLNDVVPEKGLAVVVTSGGPIGVLTARLLAGEPASWGRFNSVAVNTGVTKLISGRNGLSVVSFNEHTHLEHDRSLLTYR